MEDEGWGGGGTRLEYAVGGAVGIGATEAGGGTEDGGNEM